MRVRFRGTSTSYGVPVIGCPCPTCTSTDPRNKRTRASVYLETDEGVRLLIDSGPEIRLQALREGLTKIDFVGKTCIQPIPMRHGSIRATGYRIGNFAYLSGV